MIDFLPGVQSSSSALNAERIRMEVISQNIANAHTTRDADGNPYQRRHVTFETVLSARTSLGSGAEQQLVRVARIEKDQQPSRMVYNPGHPEADGSGMVAMPNINIHQEMADLIMSSRSFEANLAVVRNARQMAVQTMNIGKR
jgi:flagellar basal-body rod protein FlgC